MSHQGVKERPQKSRFVAVEVLFRILDTQAYAFHALNKELKALPPSTNPSDKGFITHLVYGTLRTYSKLREMFEKHLSAPEKLDRWTHMALSVAVFELLALKKPPFAVLDETVEIVKQKRGPKLANLVNAVLRKLSKELEGQAISESLLCVPPWVQEAFVLAFGREHANEFIRERAVPPLCVRLTEGTSLEQLFPEGVFADLKHEPGHAKGCHRLWGTGDPRHWIRHEGPNALWSIQEEGSQRLGEAFMNEIQAWTETHPFQPLNILEACAGHGSKTRQLLQTIPKQKHDLKLWACDLYPEKLEQLEGSVSSEHKHQLQTHAVDWTKGSGSLEKAVQGGFEFIWVDAPCSGLGTIHRRPEILLRLKPIDLKRLQKLQLQILNRVAVLLKPGGRLMYSVCSPTRAEGQDVKERFEAEHLGFVCDTERMHVIGAFGTDKGNGPDAYQWCVWKKAC